MRVHLHDHQQAPSTQYPKMIVLKHFSRIHAGTDIIRSRSNRQQHENKSCLVYTSYEPPCTTTTKNHSGNTIYFHGPARSTLFLESTRRDKVALPSATDNKLLLVRCNAPSVASRGFSPSYIHDDRSQKLLRVVAMTIAATRRKKRSQSARKTHRETVYIKTDI